MPDMLTAFVKYAGKAVVMTAVLSLMACNPNTVPNDHPPIPGNGITVLNPNGGSSYHVGDAMIITWDVHLSGSDSIAGLQMDFSPNNGLSYFIFTVLYPPAPELQDKKYVWIIPDTVFNGAYYMLTRSDSCKIFIHDYFNYTIGDVSDNVFSIR
jgi:hypothetical protein